MRTPSRILALLATLLLGLTATLYAVPAQATSPSPTSYAAGSPASYAVKSAAALPSCDLSSLPPEASDTLDLIHSGGPFPYDQDGTVFQNREGLLPSEPSGFYHEYTVKTPGSPDRGARRLVGGGPTTDPEYVYYTDDHYASFCEVDA
jgi:ribonuclease T1